MNEPIQGILKRYWGFDQFRPLQEEVIRSVLQGHDTLALMPTGGGKSLCYQVPAMAKEGLCLVISPLIALMKDQVESLRKKNITAFAIFSGMSRKEVISTLKTATSSNCKFLYVSPERLETRLFKEYLPGLPVNLVAVDEAHCISQWGYDFRPPYLRIAALREELAGIPLLALTASATPLVQKDICDKLGFAKEKIFRQSFERPNLSYSAFDTDARFNRLTTILNKVHGSAIVYCRTRKRTKQISDLLRLHQVAADYYHAGLSQEERHRKQEAWINNSTRVIVCTNAFGMGIDKPDVRVVVHADTPDSLENYYQEAGRAGRDGKKSYAVLLFDNAELAELQEQVEARFPSLADIRAVYQAIANYLQLPVNGGEGIYHDFDMVDFSRKFHLDPRKATYCLKALEQDGWMAFNEQFFQPSIIQFNATKRYLYDFQEANPVLEPLTKTLLRTYEGIFDQPVQVSEKLLAGLLELPEMQVKEQLRQLHQHRIIDYQPQKDSPQLILLRSRIKAEELTIDQVAYGHRKETYKQRVQKMISFVKEKSECRSRIIGDYFGDSTLKDCGICDNCLRRKRTAVDKQEFESIHRQIVELVKKQPMHARELFEKMGHIGKEKTREVFSFLQAEALLLVDKDGMVRIR